MQKTDDGWMGVVDISGLWLFVMDGWTDCTWSVGDQLNVVAVNVVVLVLVVALPAQNAQSKYCEWKLSLFNIWMSQNFSVFHGKCCYKCLPDIYTVLFLYLKS